MFARSAASVITLPLRSNRVAAPSRLRQTIFTCGPYDVSKRQQQERPMGTVMVRCPETGRDIPTGIVTDRQSFAATPVFFARVFCPICRTEHEWFAKEAWICEAEPPRRSALS
jgi:hypothetical protein